MKKNSFLLVFALVIIFSACKKDPFTTDDTGTFQDSRDKHDYQWVRIGTQIWLAENAAYIPFVNPSTVQSISEARSYVYGYEGTNITEAMATTNYKTYGGLYNWEAAKLACPDGWHLPTDAEWKTMEMFLGMTQADAEIIGWRAQGSVDIKLKSTTAWGANGNTNSSGFNALPAGFFSGTKFSALGTGVVFWTATGTDLDHAYDRYMEKNEVGIDRGPWSRSDGYSVRCVRN